MKGLLVMVMNPIRLFTALALLSLAAFIPDGSVHAEVIDDFDDGAWNAGDNWDAENIVQGRYPDTIEFDESLVPGMLAIRYTDTGAGDQATLILRDDQKLNVGQWVRVDAAINSGNSRGGIRIGLGLAASRGRNAPAQQGRDRANILFWGLRSDRVVRAHAYGAEGEEVGNAQAPLRNYAAGSFVTLAIRRVQPRQFELYFAPTGEPLEFVEAITFPDTEGSIPPDIPGLMIDPGNSSHIVLVDEFEIGDGWPPPSRPARPASALLPLPAPEVPENQLALTLPNNILDLPKLPGTRHVIYKPKGDGDNTYHHNAMIVRWRGRFYVAWHTSPKSEATSPFTGMLATSVDGEQWSPPVSFDIIPRGWNPTEDRLYMWGDGRVFYTEDGEQWNELPAERLANVPKYILLTASNRSFGHLRDGRLMAYGLGPGAPQFPITTDPSGLSGWTLNLIDKGECWDVGEPGGYEGPDGVLHGTIRCGTHVWHTYSRDGGETWDTLRRQTHFTDCPGNKQFGVFPDKSVWYIGNPVPGSRMELVLGHSRDGWIFDDNYLVRWEPIEPIWPSDHKSGSSPGYEYPGGLYHDGKMYVVYSRTRDYMEVSIVDVSGIVGELTE